MASIINKLFSSKKKSNHKHLDPSGRTSNFYQDQVRLILFRECDFRGRKLLFDSQSVQKISLASIKNQTINSNYVEVSNGFGYQYSRPNGDIIQLGETVFGTVAMSFRGTSTKIHSFSSPPKLMCTQVFSSPKHTVKGRASVASQPFDLQSNSSVHSLEKSTKLYSRTNSATSFNENNSSFNAESDLKIATPSGSVPLDVPTNHSMSATITPSLEGDSGFCGEQSYSSVSSGPASMSLWDSKHDQAASVHGFSCGSLYKRWLRSASTSLDHNSCSDSSLSAGVHSSASADECMTRRYNRTSKLGLAIIIKLTDGHEKELERFLLEHAALIESMINRARSGTESAYNRPVNFASLMCEVHQEISQWLTNLITGPDIGTYLWHSLNRQICKFCDINNTDSITQTRSENSLMNSVLLKRTIVSNGRNSFLNNSLLDIESMRKGCRRHLFSNCDRKHTSFRYNASFEAEKFMKELCELLETFDTKHTNFFISSLLTAVLTHHLGWVSTVLPPTQSDQDTVNNTPCNPFWGQLSDLYGAVGTPTKQAHTIICGNNKNDIISKILFILTYFIRCSLIERRNLIRCTPQDENYEAEKIFNKTKSCVNEIEKNNKHIYVDTEMSSLNKKSNLNVHINEKKEITIENKSIGLTRTKSCLENVKNKVDVDYSTNLSKQSILEKVTNLGISAGNLKEINNFKRFDCYKNKDHLMDIDEALNQVRKIFNSKNSCKNTSNDKSDVIFVLGDSDKLVGLKKNNNNEENIPGCSNERPNTLQIPEKDQINFGSQEYCYHSSTDTSPCSECEKSQRDFNLLNIKHSLLDDSLKLNSNVSKKIVLTKSCMINLELEDENDVRKRDEVTRSQSVPPSDKRQRKCSKIYCKTKYSGKKFDFKQYPQIVTNYMKNKNIELSQMSLSEKSLKLSRSFSASLNDCSDIITNFSTCDCEVPSEEILQTPSNATELEFSNEFTNESEVTKKCTTKDSNTNDLLFNDISSINKENNAIFEHDMDSYKIKNYEKSNTMSVIEFSMPRIVSQESNCEFSTGYTRTLLRGISDKYISDMVLQGISSSSKIWENNLRRDLILAARKPILDQPIQEAISIVANTDTWEVHLISSHTYLIEKGFAGVPVGMSQLIANMLDSLLNMWKLRIPTENCLLHIESRLRELCIRSKALAQLLLDTEFCDMELLTSTMQLEVNDVPLLMAIASTHTPQVTHKYGLSFQ